MSKEQWYELRPVTHERVDPPMPIRQFAAQHGLRMVVVERESPDSEDMRYYAKFDGVEVAELNMLTGAHGNGASPLRAIAEYATRISGKRIVTGAFTQERREIAVPWLKG